MTGLAQELEMMRWRAVNNDGAGAGMENDALARNYALRAIKVMRLRRDN
ncbi:MAG: hypothetical protein K6G89_01800 [Clostridia bacterium]|nr:hypothetical protein [Clostridia bacterium]